MLEKSGKRPQRPAACAIAFLVALGFAGAEVLAAPDAPATSTGDYTVSHAPCGSCATHWLEESDQDTSWHMVGEDSVSFTSKPDGIYYYRSANMYVSYDFSYQIVYSDVATVLVGSDFPVAESLASQFDHRYVVRVGYYDGDGRPDLFIERTRGGDGHDGTVQQVILRGIAGGFEPVVPSAGAASAARYWPVADVALSLRDINIDGFVDLVISGIGKLSGLSGVPGQIVVAPGRVLEAKPKAVLGIDADLRELGGDLAHYLADPDYFRATAPLSVINVTYLDYSCTYYGYDSTLYAMIDYCYPYPVTTYLIVPDYTVFAAAAIEIWQQEKALADGSVSTTAGHAEIKALIEESLGTEIGERELRELLGEAEDAANPATERALELFAALAGIANASAQEAEIEEGGSAAATAPDAVLLTGRRIVGLGPFHTALQYTGSTISAHDSDRRALYDGTLVSQVDWAPDHPLLTVRLGTVASTLPAALYWQRLLAADTGYGDDLRYDLFPSIGAGGYNSNGFVSGIIAATGGVSSEPMTGFVGGEVPVPRDEFN